MTRLRRAWVVNLDGISKSFEFKEFAEATEFIHSALTHCPGMTVNVKQGFGYLEDVEDKQDANN